MKVHKKIKENMVYNKAFAIEKKIVKWFGHVLFTFLAGVLLFLALNGALLFAAVFFFTFIFLFGITQIDILLSKIILYKEKKRIQKFKTAIETKYNIKVVEIGYDDDYSFITFRITDNKLYMSDNFQNFIADYQTKNKINDIVIICNSTEVEKENQIEI